MTEITIKKITYLIGFLIISLIGFFIPIAEIVNIADNSLNISGIILSAVVAAIAIIMVLFSRDDWKTLNRILELDLQKINKLYQALKFDVILLVFLVSIIYFINLFIRVFIHTCFNLFSFSVSASLIIIDNCVIIKILIFLNIFLILLSLNILIDFIDTLFTLHETMRNLAYQ